MDEWSRSYSFTGEDADKMLNALNQYGAFSYEREYDNPNDITDGAGTWITIHYSDGTKWESYFLSHKPPLYDNVLAALRQPVPDDIKQP